MKDIANRAGNSNNIYGDKLNIQLMFGCYDIFFIDWVVTLLKNKYSFCLFLVGIWCVMLGLIFIQPVPSQFGAPYHTPLDIAGLLLNPVVQVLIIFSFSVMCFGLLIMMQKFDEQLSRKPDKTARDLLLIAGVGLASIATFLLFNNLAFISNHFVNIVSTILYESYNPNSRGNMSYYLWKYSLNGSKIVMGLIIFPLISPVLYKIKMLKKYNPTLRR